jgi:hypothetical protein
MRRDQACPSEGIGVSIEPKESDSKIKSHHLMITDETWRAMRAKIAGKGANLSAAFEAFMDITIKYGDSDPKKIGPLFLKALDVLAKHGGPNFRVNIDDLEKQK